MRSTKTIRGLYDLCEYLGDFISLRESTMVELGSYKGDSTEVWAKYFKTVYAVDPWETGYDDQDMASNLNGAAIEEVFDRRLMMCSNVRKIKRLSRDAVDDFDDRSLDFVYIDAEHTYRAVRNDIVSWLPKICSKGFIGGHDYKKKWPGVIEAVNEQLGEPARIFSDSSYIIEVEPSLLRSFSAGVKRISRKAKAKWNF